MNREIKFRAWDDKTKTLREVQRIHIDIDGGLHLMLRGYTFMLEQCEVELMQYTGLKDKNGKELYEGDIVVGQEKESGFPPYDSTEPREIQFRNGCWCFDAGRYDDGDWIRFGFWTYSNEGTTQLKQLEVIGNIYENPGEK